MQSAPATATTSNKCKRASAKRSRSPTPPSTPPDDAPALNTSSVDEKPACSYQSLIRFAIENSTERKLTLSEIYQWVLEHCPYYRTAGSGWKNSIRHNLSLNKSFVKIPRPVNEPGKGAYWAIDYSALEAESRHKRDRSTRVKRTRSEPNVMPYPYTRPAGTDDSSSSSMSRASRSLSIPSVWASPSASAGAVSGPTASPASSSCSYYYPDMSYGQQTHATSYTGSSHTHHKQASLYTHPHQTYYADAYSYYPDSHHYSSYYTSNAHPNTTSNTSPAMNSYYSIGPQYDAALQHYYTSPLIPTHSGSGFTSTPPELAATASQSSSTASPTDEPLLSTEQPLTDALYDPLTALL